MISLKDLKNLLHEKSQHPEKITNDHICRTAHDIRIQILSHLEGKDLKYAWESTQDPHKTEVLAKLVQHTFYKDLTPQEAFNYFKEVSQYEKLLNAQIEIHKKIKQAS